MSKKWTWRGKNPSSSGLVSVSCHLSVKRLQHDGSSQAWLQRMFIFLTAPQAVKREPSSLRARMVEVLSSIAGVLLSSLNPNSVPENHFIISFARFCFYIHLFFCVYVVWERSLCATAYLGKSEDNLWRSLLFQCGLWGLSLCHHQTWWRSYSLCVVLKFFSCRVKDLALLE